MLLSIDLILFSLTQKNRVGKALLFAGSLISFACLTFSYEIAFPIVLSIAASYFLFKGISFTKKGLASGALTLSPYFLILVLYYVVFRTRTSSYEGASIKISADIITRIITYTEYVFLYPVEINVTLLIFVEAAIYLIILGLVQKLDNKSTDDGWRLQDRLLIMSAVFYFSTAILFVLNHWQTPADVMVHHIYAMTAASAIFWPSVFYKIKDFLGARSGYIYEKALVALVLPFFLLAGVSGTLENYNVETHEVNFGGVTLKKFKALKAALKDIASSASIDAILIPNLPDGSLGVSSFEGAFLQWNNFTRGIQSGDVVVGISDHKVNFLGPLSYQRDPSEERSVDDRKLYIYNFDKNRTAGTAGGVFEIDEHQRNEEIYERKASCDGYAYQNFVLKNGGYGGLQFDVENEEEARAFGRNVLVRLNGKQISEYGIGPGYAFLSFDEPAKYLFLEVVSAKSEPDKHYAFRLVRNRQAQSTIPVTAAILAQRALENAGLRPFWQEGFYGIEKEGDKYWRWAEPDASLEILNTGSVAIRATLKMDLVAPVPGDLQLSNGQFTAKIPIGPDPQEFSREIQLGPGANFISFKSTVPRRMSEDGSRSLSFQVLNYVIGSCNSF